MLDQLISKLSQRHNQVTLEQYRNWKNNPVTEELFSHLTLIQLEEFNEPLSISRTESNDLMQRREGAMELLRQIGNWVPEGVIQEENSHD